MSYEKKEQLYEGKAKKVYASNDPQVVIVSYKDDATAFNGLKKGTITGKGAINNRMTNNLMRRLEEKGVPTHYVDVYKRQSFPCCAPAWAWWTASSPSSPLPRWATLASIATPTPWSR